MRFAIISDIDDSGTIATNTSIREVERLRKIHGKARWRKKKGLLPLSLTKVRWAATQNAYTIPIYRNVQSYYPEARTSLYTIILMQRSTHHERSADTPRSMLTRRNRRPSDDSATKGGICRLDYLWRWRKPAARRLKPDRSVSSALSDAFRKNIFQTAFRNRLTRNAPRLRPLAPPQPWCVFHGCRVPFVGSTRSAAFAFGSAGFQPAFVSQRVDTAC